MEQNDLISVIVPIYNVELYLSECIDSILNQTYRNLEIILVDDGATDSSGRIADEYAKKDSRIVVIHKKNGGQSSARNAGLKVATGKFIGFIDSDDFIAPTMYEDLLYILKNNNTTIANTQSLRVNEKGEIIENDDSNNSVYSLTGRELLRELLLHKGDCAAWSKLFHRDFLLGHDFDETKLNEDFLFMLNLISDIKNVTYSNKVGHYYRQRSGSVTSKFGKTICDMVDNALYALNVVQENYQDFLEEGWRFVLYQHLIYLILIPKEFRNKENAQYKNAVKFMHKNFWKHGLCNKYLTKKDKIETLALFFCPHLFRGMRSMIHRS